jgi:sialic acid synthase SpsE
MSEIQQNFLRNNLEVIAEAGCNHGGNLETALEMVRHTRSCGADTIKFQSFVPEKLVHADDVMDWCKKSQLSYQDHACIIDECEIEKVNPLFSAFDLDSLEMLKTLDMDTVKIPSGQIFNDELLEKASTWFKRVYVSTGMCSFSRVRRAVNILTERVPRHDVVLMQCTTAYPAPVQDANLLVLERFRKEFGTPVGYSDHVHGYNTAIAAVALGATVIEKHFILNPNIETPDKCVSLNPVEFRMMVESLHEAMAARGTHIKRPRQSENRMLKRRDYGGKNGL